MINDKSQPLAGEHNKRINNKETLNNERTAAWANAQDYVSDTNVNIPDNDAIMYAKEWVDDGSKL